MVELRKYEPRLSEGMGWWSRGDGSKIIQGGGEDSRDEQMVFHVRLTQVHSEPQECYEAVELTISSYMSIVTIGKRLPAELEDLVMDFASPLPVQLNHCRIEKEEQDGAMHIRPLERPLLNIRMFHAFKKGKEISQWEKDRFGARPILEYNTRWGIHHR